MPKQAKTSKNVPNGTIAHLIKVFKENLDSYDKLPEEVKSLFIAMEITEEQKDLLVQYIKNDTVLIGYIVKNEMPKFIDHISSNPRLSKTQTLSETQIQTAHLQLQSSSMHGVFNTEINPANTISSNKRKHVRLRNIDRDEEGEVADVRDEDYEDYEDSSKEKSHKRKKEVKLSLPEQIKASLNEHMDTIFATCKTFLEDQEINRISKDATATVRKVRNDYFSLRLVIGPFGKDDKEKNQNGKQLAKIFKDYLSVTSVKNLLFVDKEGAWKNDNQRVGYKNSDKRISGKVIRPEDAIGSVILLGSTAFTCAQMIVMAKSMIHESTKEEETAFNKEVLPSQGTEFVGSQEPTQIMSLEESMDLFMAAIEVFSHPENFASATNLLSNASDVSPSLQGELKDPVLATIDNTSIGNDVGNNDKTLSATSIAPNATFFGVTTHSATPESLSKDQTTVRTIRLFGTDIQVQSPSKKSPVIELNNDSEAELISNAKGSENEPKQVKKFYFDLNAVSDEEDYQSDNSLKIK